MRSGEKEGVQYYFKTNEEFRKLIELDLLAEYRSYNTIQNDDETVWHYGIEKKEIDLKQGNHVVVVDLKGLTDLKKYYGNNIISFFIDVDEESRKLRAEARDKNFEKKEWRRRLKDDQEIFKNIDDKVDYKVQNYDFKKCIDVIEQIIKYSIQHKRCFDSKCK